MKKIYAHYEGSIHEGGGVCSLHETKDGAIKSALHSYNEKNKEHQEMYDNDKYRKHYQQYMWKKVGDTIWSNSVEEIDIIEYNLLP